MPWHRNERVAEYVAHSNKLQKLSKEERMRQADFEPPWRAERTSLLRRYREHILVASLILSIAAASAALFIH